MTDSTFEVSLRMDAFHHVNTDAAIKRRLAATLACLRRQGPTEFTTSRHRFGVWTIHQFKARVVAEHWDAAAISALAEKIHQDCISVYSPGRQVGALIGQGNAKWGDFDRKKFPRFNPQDSWDEIDAEIAARPNPSNELLMVYALKVFTLKELEELDFRPRDHFFGMLYRRFKDYDHPPTDMEVLGIKELATEHCWNAAFG